MYSYGPLHMAKQKQDVQLEHRYSIYVKIWDVPLKTCQRWWTIVRSGERGSGISMQAAWHDDDDDYWYLVRWLRTGILRKFSSRSRAVEFRIILCFFINYIATLQEKGSAGIVNYFWRYFELMIMRLWVRNQTWPQIHHLMNVFLTSQLFD